MFRDEAYEMGSDQVASPNEARRFAARDGRESLIVRIARDSKLRGQNLVILMGGVLSNQQIASGLCTHWYRM